MNRRILGSGIVATALALTLLMVSLLLVSGSTEASQPALGSSASVAEAVAAQDQGKKTEKILQPDGTWAEIAPFPTVSIPPTPGAHPLRLKRAGAAAYPPNQRLYVLGGRHGTDGEDETMRSIYEFNPTGGISGTWTLKAAQLDYSPVGNRFTANMAVAVLTDTTGPMIYAISGNSIDSIPTNTVRLYNPIADTVTTLPSDPWPVNPLRVPGGWAVHENKLYLFGGWSAIGSGSVFTETWRFDPMAAPGSRWARMADLNRGRAFIAGATLNGMIYAIGGDVWNGSTLVPVADVERYNPATNTWTTVASLPTARGDMGAWAYDTGTGYEISGKIAVAGGVFPVPDAVGYQYDPNVNAWSSFPSMVHATRNYAYAQMNGYLYAFGGYDYRNNLPSGANFNQRYDAILQGTPTATVTGTPPTSTRTATSPAASNTPSRTATVCGNNYTIATATATIVAGTTNIGSSCDDCVTDIALPFPFTLYSQTFNAVGLDSNGKAHFPTGSSVFTNTCLPQANATYTIYAYWDDLRTDTGANCPSGGCGIFTSISGTAPNRIFNIEWRTVLFTGGAYANFVLRLYEGTSPGSGSRFDIIYGQNPGNTSVTAGVQRDQSGFTQYVCNGAGGDTNSGRLVMYSLAPCVTGTPGLTATATRTVLITATSPPPPSSTSTRTRTPMVTGTPICPPSRQDVAIINYTYEPQELVINVGTTVRWTNLDEVVHTATSDTGVWDSGDLAQNQTYEFTFNAPGTYTYFCRPHPFQTGTIRVLAGCPTPSATVPASATRTTTAVATTAVPSPTVAATMTRTQVPCQGRITICHRTGNGNSHTISISCSALNAHLAHGDTVGACAAPTPRPRPNNFRDVAPTDYFYEHVLDLRDAGAIGGYNDGTFRPYNQATRAQLVKIVVLAFHIPLYTGSQQQFSDVPTTHPFYQYIMTAWRDNIITGYNDGTFRPYNNVTRGQIAKIAVESARMADLSTAVPSFRDVPTNHTFYWYIETAYAHGILNGYADGTFKPESDATRGQITKIVNLATHP